MPTYIDRALAYDPAKRRCERVFDGSDCTLDASVLTPLLLAVGLDRRARDDDELPDTVTDDMAPFRLDAKRGWCGDWLDPRGQLTGSRMWLLSRLKADEETRELAEDALQEAVTPLSDARGLPVSIAVRWVAAQVLGWRIQAGPVTLGLNPPVGA